MYSEEVGGEGSAASRVIAARAVRGARMRGGARGDGPASRVVETRDRGEVCARGPLVVRVGVGEAVVGYLRGAAREALDAEAPMLGGGGCGGDVDGLVT